MSTGLSPRELERYMLDESIKPGQPEFYARPFQEDDDGSCLHEYHGAFIGNVLFYGNQWSNALRLRKFVIEQSNVDIFDKMIESVYQDNGAAITLSVLAELVLRDIYDFDHGGLLKLTLNP